MTNPNGLIAVSSETFSRAVSQLDDLVSSCDALTFLIGAGCSKCAGLPLTRELTDMVLESEELDCSSKNILVAVRDNFLDANGAHIEDYLSEIVDLLAITDRRAERGVAQNAVVLCETEYNATQLRDASNQIKRAIAKSIRRKACIDIHRDFVTLRTPTHSRWQTSIFSTRGLSST